MRRATTLLLALTLFVSVSCGDDGPTDPDDNEQPPSGPGTGTIGAQVNGQAWSGLVRSATHVNGTLTITGTDTSQRTILVAAALVTTPGTYQLNQGNPNGAIASVIEGAAIWSSSVSGGSGTLTVTILTATRVAGSFTFTGLPATPSATGTRAVTGGQFDLGK
jgi:hypothetical protein